MCSCGQDWAGFIQKHPVCMCSSITDMHTPDGTLCWQIKWVCGLNYFWFLKSPCLDMKSLRMWAKLEQQTITAYKDRVAKTEGKWDEICCKGRTADWQSDYK